MQRLLYYTTTSLWQFDTNMPGTHLMRKWFYSLFIQMCCNFRKSKERAKDNQTCKWPTKCLQSVPTWNRKPQQQWGQDCVLTTWQWKMTGNMGGHKVAKPPSGGRVLEGPFVQSAEGWRIKDSEQLRKNHFGINSFLLKCGSSTAHTYKSHKHVHNYVYSLPMHVCDA